ncbi:hypothetical protein RHSP_36426 [Rhizobium freirei PRF 81]|uniref:Uncharacterized protein n=1 Tax=Rhizobium freirei PRF 81 TaxID=363754 RepID=N6TZ99_9HYPH|nr:hypothetical protein RHSP_36426 [Rhizobium freirei PRF 81]
MNGLIGHFNMQSIPVGIGVDGDRQDTHAARSLDHAAGDLAAIGDQNFLEHAISAQMLYSVNVLATNCVIGPCTTCLRSSRFLQS